MTSQDISLCFWPSQKASDRSIQASVSLLRSWEATFMSALVFVSFRAVLFVSIWQRRDDGHVKGGKYPGLLKQINSLKRSIKSKAQKCLESKASIRAWVDVAEGSEQKARFSPEPWFNEQHEQSPCFRERQRQKFSDYPGFLSAGVTPTNQKLHMESNHDNGHCLESQA